VITATDHVRHLVINRATHLIDPDLDRPAPDRVTNRQEPIGGGLRS
jgi:hypothetical protein